MQYTTVSLTQPLPLPFARALETFAELEGLDWSKTVPLPVLLERVNQVAAEFVDIDGSRDGRVSDHFSLRSFRHYQTAGCIDPPERAGKQVAYGVRHFLQAILVRALIRERVPCDHMARLLAGRSLEEMRRLLVKGSCNSLSTRSDATCEEGRDSTATIWKRVVVTKGIELHISQDAAEYTPAKLRQTIELLEKALRKNL